MPAAPRQTRVSLPPLPPPPKRGKNTENVKDEERDCNCSMNTRQQGRRQTCEHHPGNPAVPSAVVADRGSPLAGCVLWPSLCLQAQRMTSGGPRSWCPACGEDPGPPPHSTLAGPPCAWHASHAGSVSSCPNTLTLSVILKGHNGLFVTVKTQVAVSE